MTPSLTSLLELARAATPGPWGKVGVPYYEYWIVRADEVDGFGQKYPIAEIKHASDRASDAGHYANTQRAANAAYIAAAHPARIIELVTELDRVQAEIRRLRAKLGYAQQEYAEADWASIQRGDGSLSGFKS